MIVHLEVDQHQSTFRFIEFERLVVPQLLAVKLARGIQVVGAQTNVRDTHDAGSLRACRRLSGTNDCEGGKHHEAQLERRHDLSVYEFPKILRAWFREIDGQRWHRAETGTEWYNSTVTTLQLNLFNCVYLIVLAAVAFLTRATRRRIEGAIAGAAAAGVVGLGI